MAKKIKNRKDFALGVVMLVLGLYLLLAQGIVKGMTLLSTDITIAKAGTYVRLLGGLLVLLSGGLTLRALGVFGKCAADEEENSETRKKLDPLVPLLFGALLLYMPLMSLVGFTASSMILIAWVAFWIRYREKHVDLHDKQALLKNIGIAVVYSVILVLVLELMFTKGLHVRLP